MHLHTKDHLTLAARRHERLMAEADVQRTLRAMRTGTPLRRARIGAASALRALARRLEPKGRGRLA